MQEICSKTRFMGTCKIPFCALWIHRFDMSGICTHKVARNAMHHGSNRRKVFDVIMLFHTIRVVARPGSALFSPLKHFQHLWNVGSSSSHILSPWVWKTHRLTSARMAVLWSPNLLETAYGFLHNPTMSI